MQLPILNELNTSREMIEVFKGYNHNLRISDGEFYDMKNLTSSYYPVLSPRGVRGTYATPLKPGGLIAKDTLCYVDGSEFVVGDERVEMGLSDSPKTLVSMGAYVIIMPDKMYINVQDLDDFGKIEASVSSTEEVSFLLCSLEGEDYDIPAVAPTPPDDPLNMEMWIDTSSTPHRLKQYSEQSAIWTTVATTYVKIHSKGIGEQFEVYDSVDISGIEIEQVSNLNGNMIVWGKGNDYIIVVGIIDESKTQKQPITISRSMPAMDFIIESENRLWGCRYGTNNKGDIVNEIYASKLGDFKNWTCYMGLSTDSYAVTVGTDGAFTGAITHRGYPLFFKEHCMHKIYGNYPANYQINTTTCRGVQKGSHKSLAIVNEDLYYKSRKAICVYDGSLPQEISYNLGDVAYTDAVAGSLGNKYYISMHDSDTDTWNLFVYDAKTGLWHKEDNAHAEEFCSCRGELYFIENGTGEIKTVGGSGTPDDKPVQWMAETGIIGTDSPDKKTISRINVRMSLAEDSLATIYIQYDSSGEWEYVLSAQGSKLRTKSIPIKPKRCDHLRLRIEGRGDCKIYSIAKSIMQGSDT